MDNTPADAPGSSPARLKTEAALRSVNNRSRISNGREILPGCDQRLAVARRYRDLIAMIVADLGGLELCSEAKLQLIRRFAAIAVMAEDIEAQLARGERIDVAQHTALSSTLVRLGQRIGLRRAAKNVVPSLADYIEQEYPEAQERLED
jgi:hypothetical protein